MRVSSLLKNSIYAMMKTQHTRERTPVLFKQSPFWVANTSLRHTHTQMAMCIMNSNNTFDICKPGQNVANNNTVNIQLWN